MYSIIFSARMVIDFVTEVQNPKAFGMQGNFWWVGLASYTSRNRMHYHIKTNNRSSSFQINLQELTEIFLQQVTYYLKVQ